MALAEERREVQLPDSTVLFFRKPGMQDHEEAEWEYSRIFNKAIKNGIVPREVMKSQLREQGIWTDDDDARSEALEEEMVVVMADLQSAADEDDKKNFEEARREVARVRNEMIEHNSKLNAFLNNCAEEKAGEARIFYLTYACAETEDGKKFWKSFEEFKTKTDPAIVNTAFFQFMLFINNLSANLTDSFVENKVQLRSERPEAKEIVEPEMIKEMVAANEANRSGSKT